MAAEIAGRRGAHPATTLFIGFVVAAAIWTVIVPLWTWPFHLLANPDIAWRVVAVGLLGTLIPFALTVAALRWISSAVAGIATTAEPVLAAGLAWWLLGQALGRHSSSAVRSWSPAYCWRSWRGMRRSAPPRGVHPVTEHPGAVPVPGSL